MEWFILFTSVALIWLASLCKIILHASFYPHRSSFLNNNSAEKRNALLVIAHPDDESMFFSPTINQLTSRGHNVHILCMSTGNADNMGNARKEELYKASAILKVPIQQVTVMDHPDFQDGFGKTWNTSLLSKIVEKKINDHAIDIIITFDNYGVSGHCNHRDVHHGVQFMLDTSHHDIEAWELVSTNIIRKYSGPIDIWFSLWSAQSSLNGQMHCVLNEYPRCSYAAMSQHLSQWVWFRKLFVEDRELPSMATRPDSHRKMALRQTRSEISREKKRPKINKKKKKKQLDDEPKKPPTAFFYFLEDFRKEFQEQNPHVKSMREIGKACGAKWKIMTYEEKVQYYDVATEKRAKFEKALADYVKKQENREYDDDSDYNG